MKKLLTIPAAACLILANGFNANAQYDTLRSFNGTNGNAPKGSLVMAGNVLLGMTEYGGASAKGNVFSIHTNGADMNSFYSFNGTHGQNPYGNLTYVGGHTVYGMTYSGGANGYGCVFSIDTNGNNYRDLWDFNGPSPGTNGKYPTGSLTVFHNKLYGMTSSGGINTAGNIFSIDTNGGSYKDLYDFNVASGDDPVGALIPVGKYFYGMNQLGGANAVGDIFSIDSTGAHFKDRHDFSAAPNGSVPYGSLVSSGTQLFGMTSSGGFYTYGNVFSIDTDGADYKNLLSFSSFSNHDTGSIPYGDLLLKGNVLFGMTSQGGTNGTGSIFRVDTNGNQYADLWNFTAGLTGTGNTPNGSLILSGSEVYGMTSAGGPYSDGVVFVDTLISVKTTDTNISCNGANDGHATTYVKGGIAPLTYSWTGGSTVARATGLSTGSYTVTVTDNDGFTATASISISQPALLAISMHSTTDEMCSGAFTGSATANAATGGTVPYTYSWAPSGGSTISATGLSAGAYTLTVMDKHGCSASTSTTITQPNPITATTYMKQDDGSSDGEAAVTASGGTQPYTYSWYPVPGNTDTLKGLHATRNFCCVITDANGCIDTVCILVSSDLGINNINTNSAHVSVYPNPNNGTFTIESANTGGKSLAEIYNILGERVSTVQLTGTATQIDLTTQPEGIYLYRVVTENGALIGEGKLIIQK